MKFLNKKKTSCPNEALKKQGFFFVEKYAGRKYNEIIFKVILKDRYLDIKEGMGQAEEDEYLATLKAEKYGICNRVDIKVESSGCGLATALMEVCFEDDEDVGGVNPETDKFLKQFKTHQKQANLNCEKLIYLQCEPDHPHPYSICVAYLNAAITRNYDMLFSFPSESETGMDIMELESEAKPKFKRSSERFVEKHGNGWFFCRCKKEKREECLAMSDYKSMFCLKYENE